MANKLTLEYYEHIEQLLVKLVAFVQRSAPLNAFAIINEFIDVGEYGLAFEALCFDINETKPSIPTPIRAIIQELGRLMQIDMAQWPHLSET